MVCSEHVEIDKTELSQHLIMAGSTSSLSAAAETSVRGDAAAKCLLALALCHSTVRDPVAPAESSSSSSSAAAAAPSAVAASPPSLLSCCVPHSPPHDDVSLADLSAGLGFGVCGLGLGFKGLGFGLLRFKCSLFTQQQLLPLAPTLHAARALQCKSCALHRFNFLMLKLFAFLTRYPI